VSWCQKKSSSALHGAREDIKGRHADNPTGRHSILLISDPPPSSPILTPDALPAATLPVYPGLGQTPNMLACIPSGLVLKINQCSKKPNKHTVQMLRLNLTLLRYSRLQCFKSDKLKEQRLLMLNETEAENKCPFSSLFFKTTYISQRQKGQINLDFNEARDRGDGSGIIWTICISLAPLFRQITTPVHHHSIFYRPDALPDAKPTVSKHSRQQK